MNGIVAAYRRLRRWWLFKRRAIIDRYDRRKRPLTVYFVNVLAFLMVLSPYSVRGAIESDVEIIRMYTAKIADEIAEGYIYADLDPNTLREIAEEAMGVNPSRMFRNAMHAISDVLEPHSFYMEPADYGAYRSEAIGKQRSFGFRVRERLYYPEVVYVFPGSPAEKAGIKPGDMLVTVNNSTLYRKSADYVDGLLQDKRYPVYQRSSSFFVSRSGERLWFPDIRHANLFAPCAFVLDLGDKRLFSTFVRDAIPEPDPLISGKRPGLPLYVRIMSLQDGVSAQFAKIIKDAGKRGVTEIILDLRDNPGGLVRELERICRMLLPKKYMYYTARKNAEPVGVIGGGKQPFDRVIVLINGGTVSAAEILAGALQDSGIATLIGSTTYGKGAAQDYIHCPDGGAFKYSTVEFYRLNGRKISGIGITPDIVPNVLLPIHGEMNALYDSDPTLYEAEIAKVDAALRTFADEMPDVAEMDGMAQDEQDLWTYVRTLLDFGGYMGVGETASSGARPVIDLQFVERLNIAINEYNIIYDDALACAIRILR